MAAVAFSPDGRRLALHMYDDDLDGLLYIWDGRLRLVRADLLFRPGWSTMREELVVTTSDGVMAIDLNGKKRFSFEPIYGEPDARISPDGRTALQIHARTNGFVLYGRRTGRGVMSLPATAVYDRFIDWVGTDEFVIRAVGYGPSDYYRVDVDTGAAIPVAADIPMNARLVRFPAPGPDGG